ncbi:MAG: hypothetical protein ACKPFF_11410 [Planktothrix sp.]
MLNLVEEIEKREDYILEIADEGLVLILTPHYVVRIIGEELTEIADRKAFDALEDVVITRIGGVPYSIRELDTLLNNLSIE